MNSVTLIFPHQLFPDPAFARKGSRVIMVEEDLYFRQYPFHKAKLVFHRASMRYYREYLEKKGVEVRYMESGEQGSDIRDLLPLLAAEGISEIRLFETGYSSGASLTA